MRFWNSWADPLKVLMYRERYDEGCRACKRSVWDRAKNKYKCKLSIAGHPENDSSCIGFKRREK